MPRSPVHLPAVLGVLLLAAACNQVQMPGRLPDRTVALGHELSQTIIQNFAGSWEVVEKPAWLSVSTEKGSGRVRFTVTADRGQGTPVAADQAQLSGRLQVSWTSGTGSWAHSGKAEWTVTAEQFEVQGQVVEPVSVHGEDLQVSRTSAARSGSEAHGVIVKYRVGALGRGEGLSSQALAAQATQLGVSRLQSSGVAVRGARALSAQSAVLQVSDTAAALRTLRADPQVEYAVPNTVIHTQGMATRAQPSSVPAASSAAARQASPMPAPAATPPLAQPLNSSDQYAPLQWAYRLLGYPAVWRDMEAGGYARAVTVAVVDSGVRFDHPDLAGRLWGPGEGALDVLPKFVDSDQSVGNGDTDGPDTDPTDPDLPGRTLGSHGTHVTGIIAARWGDNGPSCAGCSLSGVAGATSRATVKVLPVRAIDADGNTDIAQVATAIRYSAGLPVTLEGVTYTNPHPAQVINLSLGGDIGSDTAQPMCEAVLDASQAGALLVVAAGNGYGTAPYYPAACPGAVAVGSVTLSGGSAPRRATYSNAYPAVQLSAPGGTDYLRDATYHNGASWDPQGDGSAEPFVDAIISTGWNYTQDRPVYEVESGTSQAAPQVAALAALLLSKGVTTDAPSTLARLTSTATDLGSAGRDDLFGFGMINASAALGAPPISDTLGLRLQDSRGLSFQPAIDTQGRFRAYLGDGTYRIVAGRDRNGNGVYVEAGEPGAERSVTLGPDSPSVNIGQLSLR